MNTRTAPPRFSPGFSLDEAARIRRMIVTHEDRMTCPHCGTELRPTGGRDGTRRVWLVWCDVCDRGVVVHGNG